MKTVCYAFDHELSIQSDLGNYALDLDMIVIGNQLNKGSGQSNSTLTSGNYILFDIEWDGTKRFMFLKCIERVWIEIEKKTWKMKGKLFFLLFRFTTLNMFTINKTYSWKVRGEFFGVVVEIFGCATINRWWYMSLGGLKCEISRQSFMLEAICPADSNALLMMNLWANKVKPLSISLCLACWCFKWQKKAEECWIIIGNLSMIPSWNESWKGPASKKWI